MDGLRKCTYAVGARSRSQGRSEEKSQEIEWSAASRRRDDRRQETETERAPSRLSFLTTGASEASAGSAWGWGPKLTEKCRQKAHKPENRRPIA